MISSYYLEYLLFGSNRLAKVLFDCLHVLGINLGCRCCCECCCGFFLDDYGLEEGHGCCHRLTGWGFHGLTNRLWVRSANRCLLWCRSCSFPAVARRSELGWHLVIASLLPITSWPTEDRSSWPLWIVCKMHRLDWIACQMHGD